MSSLNEFSQSGSLVDQILEQGQRLRNAMVQSILNNDPFNTDIIGNKNKIAKEQFGEITVEDKEKFVNYLRGDVMSKAEKKQALDTFRKLSNIDICDITEGTCLSNTISCGCDTCKAYYKETSPELINVPQLNLHSFRGRNYVRPRNEESAKNDFVSVSRCLKYVDSLKLHIHYLNLNEEGIKKVCRNNTDVKMKLPPSYSYTYFIEYSLPDVIIQNFKSKSKIDTGLHANKIRICSKVVQNEAVYFKQMSMHEVVHLDKINLKTLNITFHINCRMQRQKGSLAIGFATFNFGSFENTKYLTCNQELTLLDNNAPIAVGNLKITIQLGCGKLYFGKEFIDGVCSNKENIILLPELTDCRDDECYFNTPESAHVEVGNKTNTSEATSRSKQKSLNELPIRIVTKAESPKASLKSVTSYTDTPKLQGNTNLAQNEPKDIQIFFGFIYVPEAEYLDSLNSYFTVRPFAQEDLLYSRLVYCSSNPIFNFHQLIPLVYEDDLIHKLRDNFMIFEFFQKSGVGKDELIGVSKIPLHQFYVAFRNPTIVKYLLRNELPVIAADWWEPISDPLNGKLYGQVQVLVAFGSEQQVRNLEAKRGFQDNIVVAKPAIHIAPVPAENRQNTKPLKKAPKQAVYKKNNKLVLEQSKTIKINTEKEDKGTQSVIMESKEETEMQPKMNLQNQDILGTFLLQLIQQRQTNNYVENSTNTEVTEPEKTELIENDENHSETNVRKTSDLLDTLEKALHVDNKTEFSDNSAINENKHCFKAHIFIEEALHLPTRKKCKARKSKCKNLKQEEIFPSTYVTFETMPNDMKVTSIVQKSSNPKWDFRCDVSLPTNLLTTTQKRLIFKIWRKCAGNSVTPNFQTDVIIGFAALDLTVLLAGLPTLQGWFNILDFSTKCNGQIKINVTPLENLSKFNDRKYTVNTEVHNEALPKTPQISQVVATTEKNEEPSESLSRALKRKFIELDEITQRLRLRLSNVTNDESDFNDELIDEFEHDINTLCVEDDYDLIDFEEENEKSNFTMKQTDGLLQIETVPQTLDACSQTLLFSETPRTINTLDKQLLEGKQRIDSLLEKLSLMTNSESEDIFSNRYVSGCSVNQESTNKSDILLSANSNNIDPDCIINPILFQTLCTASLDSTPPVNSENTNNDISSSDNSLIISSTDCRAAPDGAGYISDSKVPTNQ